MTDVGLKETILGAVLGVLAAVALVAPRSDAAIPVVDVPHTIVSKVEWAIAGYQKGLQLYNDYLELKRMYEFVWADPENEVGEFVYWNGLVLAGTEEGVPEDGLVGLAYSVEDIEEKVRYLYSGSTFDPADPGYGYISELPLEHYGDLERWRTVGRREASANTMSVLRGHRDQVVDRSLRKRAILDSIESGEGGTQLLQALAHLSAMEVEEQMVARELQMAILNGQILRDLDDTARKGEEAALFEASFSGLADAELPVIEERGVFPWS